MNDAKSSGYQTRMMVLLTLSFGFVFLDRNAFSYLAPFIAPELQLNNTQIGMITSALSFTWALSAYFIGRLSDATGKRKPFLLVAFVVFSLSSVFSGFASSVAMLMVARLVMGFAEGPILPISQSLVVLETTEAKRGNAMGIMQNFGSNFIGSFVAPLLLVAIATAWSWRAAFFVAAVPGLIMVVLMAKYLREPPKREVSTLAGAQDGPDLGILDMLRNRNIALSVLICIAMVAWMVLGWAFLPLYYTSVRHMPASEMSWQISVLGISAAAFAFVVPRLSDVYGRKPILVIFCLVGVLVPLAAYFWQGSPYVLALLVFLGWSASGAMPIFMGTIPSETLPSRYLATSLGLVVGLGEIIGGVLSPTLAGRAADLYGLQATLLIMGACAVVASLLSLFIKETAPIKVGRLAQASATA